MSNKKDSNNGEMLGAWIAIGTGVGVALGTALDNIAIGIALGTGIGVAIGTALSQGKK